MHLVLLFAMISILGACGSFTSEPPTSSALPVNPPPNPPSVLSEAARGALETTAACIVSVDANTRYSAMWAKYPRDGIPQFHHLENRATATRDERTLIRSYAEDVARCRGDLPVQTPSDRRLKAILDSAWATQMTHYAELAAGRIPWGAFVARTSAVDSDVAQHVSALLAR